MSLRGGRHAGAAGCRQRAVAGFYQQHGQCAGRSRFGLPDRHAVARRGSRYGDGLYQRVSVVRCRRAESARLGVCVTAQFALSGQQCAIDELRHGARSADPRIFDRRLLGQLLSWPPLVQPAIPLGTPSAAAAASSGRGAATGRPLSAGRATAAGSSGRSTSGRAATGECWRTTAGRAATG